MEGITPENEIQRKPACSRIATCSCDGEVRRSVSAQSINAVAKSPFRQFDAARGNITGIPRDRCSAAKTWFFGERPCRQLCAVTELQCHHQQV